MASTRLSKIKGLLKDNNTKPKKDPADLSSETNLSSVPEPVSGDTKTSSVAVNIPVPTADIPKIPELSKTSLWDRAYDSLRARDEKLVEEYELLLSRELQTNTSPKNAVGYDDDGLMRSENQIQSNNRKIRLTQLEAIADKALWQLDEKKARYNIFGHEFIVRDQLAHATQFIQTIKDAIDVAVRASPEASLAWAGFCVILPVFMNPSTAEEASRDGYLYVTSRINFYVKLESLLSANARLRDSGLHAELEGCLVTLYRLIIDFQIRTVRRVYLTRFARFKEDTIQHEDWKGMIAKIQKLEELFGDEFKLAKDAAMGLELEKLNGNAEKLFFEINSMLGSISENGRDASKYHFQNHGLGNQFNATGGTQNNVTGSGQMFPGATFSGAVTFNY